ncbi:hypothetical protein E4P39_18690 [Blastococcus sp. CT_GayMR19]|uniref:DUF6221 family protein n=1 Tax=Blastococcus sp. CT_GayMR19 TaxID=2559608 RepID=UPI0010740BCC|nr:DUF6221 family protein [Blastococcus sp. CT_GayMR19]TFV71334.1 hypothetical protein E4P39_18690 [Blastococcus sp. CT_GayMR19]
MDEIGLDVATMNLDEFLLARIAEDKRVATDAAGADRKGEWGPDLVGDGPGGPRSTAHVVRHDPARVLAECSAKRRIVLACRDARPETAFVGIHPRGMADFPVTAQDQHQLAALTLALLALPYADHPHYRPEWRP